MAARLALLSAAIGVCLAGPADAARFNRQAQAVRSPAKTSARPGRIPRTWRRAKTSAGKLRFVAGYGVGGGLVAVTGVGAEGGLLIRSVDEARAEGVRRVAVYASAGGNLSVVGGRGYLSNERSLIGYEYNIGPGSKRSPIHGDRIGVSIIPGIVGISVSRKGGLGMWLSGIPVPFGRYPLVWGTALLYVGHPAMAPMSNAVLDKVDTVKAWIGRRLRWIADPVVRLVRRSERQHDGT